MDFNESRKFLEEIKKEINRFDNDDWLEFIRKIKLSYSFPYIHITGINHKEETAIYL